MTGRRVRVGGVGLAAAPGVRGLTRVGLIAGRRVGNAVDRNRARRRIRHAMREVNVKPGQDYVVIATPSVVRVPYRVLVTWLSRCIDEVSA